MILGVDGRSSRDEDADHLAGHIREVVARVLGEGAAAAAVLTTHGLGGSHPRTVVSCTVPPAVMADDLVGGLLVEDSSGARRIDRLLAAVAGAVDDTGAVVITTPGLADGVSAWQDPNALAGAWAAVAAAATRESGRLVHFPGQDRLVDRLTVEQVLAGGAVDDVDLLGGGLVDGATVVDTRDFVRPRLAGGRVRLLVQPAAGGVVVPFEREHPHRCCDGH